MHVAGLSVVPIPSVPGIRGPHKCIPQGLLFLWPEDNNDEYSGT